MVTKGGYRSWTANTKHGERTARLPVIVFVKPLADEPSAVRGSLRGQEVTEHHLTVLGQYGLRMELHAFDGQFLVPQSHDQPIGRFR